MHFGSMMSRAWKTTAKTVGGIFTLFLIVLILPRPVDALQTALVRASDGNVYRIRFPNGNLSGGYNTGDFIDDFSIYDETGTVELCPGNDQSVTRELYTAARVLAQTPRNTPLFDTSALADIMTQTAEGFGIDQEGNVDVVGIVGDIVEEMAVDELQGQIQSAVDPSLNLGIATINLNTFKIKINVSGPDIIVKPTEFLSRLVSDEIELRWMLYAFSRASTYANTTIHLQILANHRAAALWDAINAGKVVDIAGHAFTIHEDAIRISNEIGVFDPFRLRLAAGVYRAYAEYVAELGTNLAEHEGPVAILANRISVDIITEFLFTLSDAQSAIAEKEALDELDAQIPGDINLRLHANINSIYDSATSDLTQHGFCSPDLRFTSIPPTVAEGDSLTYTVALNSAPSIVAAIAISSNNPDVMVSPASLTFTPNNWYIPKRVVVDVSADADSIDESVSLKHIVVGYGGGMVRNIQFDITDQVSNRAPRPADTIPDQTLTVGDSSAPLDLSTYFHDPDSDSLIYTVVSSDANVATAQHIGSQLTVWTLNIGKTTLTIRATDPEGLFAIQTFNVTVTADETEIETEIETPTQHPTPQGLNVGDAVIVQNTIRLGLNIRSDPWIPNDGTDNRIGKAYDGATGTIRSGTQPDAEGRTWWQVEWDASDKVEWQHQPANQQGWSVEATGKVGLLASRPQEPVTQSFDLVIESFSVSKNTLDPNESFTLSIIIRNDGPGDSPGPVLSYYHSSVQGFSPTDPPQLQGTVSLGPLASGERTTQSIQLAAPATPKTYYYGAWLAANTGDTNLNNDAATEVGVTVINNTVDDPVDTSDPPDLVIASISVDYDTMYPGERFTVSATVRNAGGRRAANARLRYYRSSDATFSSDDEELVSTDDFIGGLEGGETSDETANLDAPDTQGVYYYIARAEPVRNEEDTDNNYDAVAITVLPPAAPDYVIVSLTSNRYLVDPGKYFRLDATVLNQGEEDARETTTVRFYRSLDPIPSPDDEEVRTDTIRALRDGKTDYGVRNGPAPEQPGAYYYYACVDAVSDERITDNNCSDVVTINVRGPDLVVNTVSVDYFSRTHTTVRPDGIFELEVTVRNQGTEDADDSTLRYYTSSDATLSSDDTEVATDRVFSLDPNETSKTYKSDWIRVPYTSGFFYALVCVDSLEDESDTDNNCFEPIKLTVRNYAPQAVGTIPVQTLTAGTSMVVDVSDYFTDGNNDNLTYTASSSDPNIAMASVSGAQVTLTPQGSGSATIAVTASDSKLTATQTFSVSVMETKVPDLLVESVRLEKNRVDPGEKFRLNAVVKNQGEVGSSATPLRYYQSTDATISDTDTEVYATILPMIAAGAKGEPSIKLTAPDAPGTYYYGVGVEGVADESDTTNNYSIGIAVTVENRAPSAVGTLPPQTLSENDAPVAVDVAGYFNDPNNTTLTYTAVSDNASVILAQMSGSQVTITPVGAGNASVTVTASDSALTATQTFSVSVIADLPEETWMPDANLRVAVRDALGIAPNHALTPQAMSGLRSLRYRGSELSDNRKIVNLTGLEYALNLDHLNLYAHLISDILPLEKLTKLRSLWLTGNKITNIRPLTSLPLEKLGLGGNPIADFAPLAELRSLTRLDFWGSGLGDRDLHFITGLTQLTHLNLRNNQVSDITLVTKLVNLEVLQLKGNPISDTSPLRELLRLNPDLEIDIEIREELPTKPDPTDPPDLSSEVLIPDANLRAAVRDALGLTPNDPLTQQAMQKLTRLDVQLPLEPAVKDQIKYVTGLEHATQLTELVLAFHQISDLTLLKNLTKLTKLSIWGCKVSDLTPLKNLTELTYLGLSYNGQISDLTPLKNLTELRTLFLESNQISDLTPLKNLTELTGLTVGFNNQISDLTPLKSLTELRWLSVGGNQIRDITPLTGLTKLTRLWLFQNQISDVTPLESLTKLTELLLNKNPIADLTPLHRLQAKNPGLEIDIEISEEPPSEPDPEVETEGPDLIIESLRVNNTTVATGDRFRLDVVIRNQGKAASGAATLRFYRSSDETISTVDTQVTRSSLPVVAANATRNKWVRLTAPNTAGVYYYGVCVDGIADENDTGNNCSTVVKITVGTPAIDEPPVDATSLAKQVFEKHSRILRRQDVKEVLSNVLTALKDPDIQPLLIPATINLVIADPDFLKKTVPTIPDEFITLLKTDAEIKTLLSDPQVQKLLQMPAAIDELAKLLGISVAPPSTPDGTVVFRDANLANKVREALNLPTGADIPKAKLATLTRLDASVYATATAAEWEKISIKNLTGLEHATQLKTLFLVNHRVSNITPLAGLKKLEVLDLTGKAITDIGPLGGLTNLRILYLTGGGARSRIKDLTPFARLTNLTWLSINGTSFYNNDLIALAPSLAKMKNLEVLNLPYNQISNVTPLASVPSLKRLDLRNNQISDVTPLARLTNLENLWIFGNPITDEAQFQVLLRQNPDLQIYTEDLTSAQLNAPSISVLSAETALLPNYPNPFNPETWIPYRLAKATDVTVTIYDVRGVVVRRLALGHKSAGFYQNRARAAHWDGRNTLGEKVASGLYFYTFTAEDFTATRRMLIRK